MNYNFKLLTPFFLFLISLNSFSQINSDSLTARKKNENFPAPNTNKNFETFLSIGVINGKIKDSQSLKNIGDVSVFVFANKFDSATKSMKEKLIQNIQTRANGEFSIENLPLMQKIRLQFVGTDYETLNKNVAFKFNPKDMQNGGADMMQNMIAMSSIDLGNIYLNKNTNSLQNTLSEIVVSSKKISNIGTQVFNVDNNLVTAGATAQELLKTIPMVSVDIDGNVTVRNSSPQIFVDGKISTLSLDQIPADMIERVEIMTSPSAKFDAEGQGGILNIILKRSKKIGINGMLMLGSYLYMKPYASNVDLFHYNGGLILNVRKNKINAFINALTFRRKFHSLEQTDRNFNNEVSETSIKNIAQQNITLRQGNIYTLRGGFDFFASNRSTISLETNYMTGWFDPYFNFNQTYTNYIGETTLSSRFTKGQYHFENIRSSATYKLTFPRQGREFTSMLFGNFRTMDFTNTFSNQYGKTITAETPVLRQQNHMVSNASNYRFQLDYIDPFTETKKIETGFSGNYSSTPFVNNYNKLNSDLSIQKLLSNVKYDYSDLTLAAYATYTQTRDKMTAQLGLRVEKFFYSGNLYDSNNVQTSYLFTLPFKIFPSLFLTYNINEKNSVQLSYTMRVNRPSIFNLIPIIDYSDSTNLRRGNPLLQPETIHIAELNYQYTTKNNYMLFALYTKFTDNVITSIQAIDSSVSSKNLLLNTFINSNYALSYGTEIVFKNSLWNMKINNQNINILDLTTNFNFYNTILDGGTNHSQIQAQRWSFYVKETVSIKLPKGFSFQTFLEYQHTTLLPPSTGNRTSANNQQGGPNFGPPASNSQGYIRPNFGVDMAFKKEFLKGFITLTLAGTDVFNTKKYNAYTYTNSFYQNAWSVRNQSLYYLSLNMRLGKMDTNVMKKKNIKAEKENVQQGGGEGF